ncbi:MAG: hypothetical protein ACLRSW_15280 [Christensenellaceae bacterium]
MTTTAAIARGRGRRGTCSPWRTPAFLTHRGNYFEAVTAVLGSADFRSGRALHRGFGRDNGKALERRRRFCRRARAWNALEGRHELF